MRKNIFIERAKGRPVDEQKIEIVERKGLGHPDYIADSVAEAFSKNLSKYYIANFGKIFHHNVDKLEIVGGSASTAFGGGTIDAPISVIFSGRATEFVDGKKLPIEEIAIGACKEWLSSNMRFLDPNSIRFTFETKSGSENLAGAFKRKGSIGSNDTSFGVGYAPLSKTESLVFEVERFLNSKDFKTRFPFSGEDVKVMGVRIKDNIDLTIAMAFVDSFVPSAKEYFDKKAVVLDAVKQRFDQGSYGKKLKISLNNMDSKREGEDGCYLTVTGSSSEHGDDGAVGRGNRVNGLITPGRPMSLEAVAGKNPVNHIGKIYNLFSHKLANELNATIGVPLTVKAVGRIGSPLENPIALSIETYRGLDKEKKAAMKRLIIEELDGIRSITKEILEGKLAVC